jgi:hypothetical protein
MAPNILYRRSGNMRWVDLMEATTMLVLAAAGSHKARMIGRLTLPPQNVSLSELL